MTKRRKDEGHIKEKRLGVTAASSQEQASQEGSWALDGILLGSVDGHQRANECNKYNRVLGEGEEDVVHVEE